MTFTVGDLFDIQITDAIIDEEVTRDAFKLFTAWANKEKLGPGDVLASQVLNKWRPLPNNIAIITSRQDLKVLTKKLEICNHFEIMFCFQNVLRVRIL